MMFFLAIKVFYGCKTSAKTLNRQFDDVFSCNQGFLWAQNISKNAKSSCNALVYDLYFVPLGDICKI